MQEQAIARKEPQNLKQVIASDYFKSQVAMALNNIIPPEYFVRVALTALLRQPMLAECSQASMLNALLTLAQAGLPPDGRRAHLVPFRNFRNNTVEVVPIIDYKGLVQLVMGSGEVSNVHADVICDKDVFRYSMGEVREHTIDFRQPRGEAYAAYAMARMKDGAATFQVMTKAEIEKVRASSKAANNGPWVTHWEEMAKKTVFRRLCKWLNLSPSIQGRLESDDEEQFPSGPTLEVKPPTFLQDGPPMATPATPEYSDNAVPAAPAADPANPVKRGPGRPRKQKTEEQPVPGVGGAPESLPAEPLPENELPLPPAKPQPPAEESPLWVKLQAEIEVNGFTVSDLLTWGEEVGHIPNGTSFSALSEVPSELIQRLHTAKAGLIRALKEWKGIQQ